MLKTLMIAVIVLTFNLQYTQWIVMYLYNTYYTWQCFLSKQIFNISDAYVDFAFNYMYLSLHNPSSNFLWMSMSHMYYDNMHQVNGQ